jgi:hypothetical protein
VVYRVLQNLLILDGERLSYRGLDVEQIGSVYETMMGFNLRVAEGRSIAIKPTKSHGAPATINLEALLAAKPGDRAKWLVDQTDQKVTGQAADTLKKAASLDDLLAALEKKIAWRATLSVVPKAAMILQPSDERRRSGSHYTPRSLTEPIVHTTLRPVLERLRGADCQSAESGEGRLATCPTPDQLLDLNVCDPAMGSGAFLVATCRQLGDELVKAWHVHNQAPKLPPDEDEILYARRLIAQRCLYGVDRNPVAVDLAKLSLWLATLAKDHPFTFLDHTLRAGDSLVGLTQKQIAAFHWKDVRRPSSVVSGGKRRVKGTDNGPRTSFRRSDRRVDQAGDGVSAENPGSARRGDLRASAPAARLGRRGDGQGPARRRPHRCGLFLCRERQGPRGAPARTGPAAGQVPRPRRKNGGPSAAYRGSAAASLR